MLSRGLLPFTCYCSQFCLHVCLFSVSDAPWTVLLANIEPESTGVTVGGLIPARSYQFRLCAVNDVGRGQFSKETDRLVLHFTLFCIYWILEMLLVVCNLKCANSVVGFHGSGTNRSLPPCLESSIKKMRWLFSSKSTLLVFTPVGASERWASFGMGLFQDKTVNELKLRFVKTWWVRWPSFISLPPINSLRRTSWVKYREAGRRQSFKLRQTQISNKFSSLARRS